MFGVKYLCDPEVIPTVVPGDIGSIASYAAQCAAFASWLHVDIADGTFAPNTTWPFALPGQESELGNFRALIEMPPQLNLEAHLMVSDPLSLGESLARAGFARITAHREAFMDASEARGALDVWRRAGAREAGLGLKLHTPLEDIEALVEQCDFVLLMSIGEIGVQGKPFDESVISRIEELHARYPDLMVAVDGGVSESTIESLVRAGANRMSVGSAISRSADPEAAYAQILERAERGCAPLAA